MKVADARRLLVAEEEDKLIDMDAVTEEALRRAEQDGIIFIDEIDKVAGRSANGPDVSREGRSARHPADRRGQHGEHQIRRGQDRLHALYRGGRVPCGEGDGSHSRIAGAFPGARELKPLTREDFKAILSQTDNALTRQYEALLAVDHVHLHFEESALTALAQAAQQENETREDIGARRLHTLFEKMLGGYLLQRGRRYAGRGCDDQRRLCGRTPRQGTVKSWT